MQVFLLASFTAVATGFGALPFIFVKNLTRRWLGASNAVAMGLMLAASFGLVYEGLDYSALGTLGGAGIGLVGFVFPIWLENLAAGSTLYWLAALPIVASSLLLVYAIFPGKPDGPQRQRLVLISAGLTGVTALILLILNFSLLQLFLLVVATLAGAAAGWTAGIGYARAGGEEMLPPEGERVR